ncbi:MAG: hypothetical protein J6C38_09320 [Oscillospiraceae bacterium]|nr:hypothetical protein [Oscillospiraceae bacterium]
MQRKNAKTSVKDFFDANARNFIKFGRTFIANLTDEGLINELAHKDLEKLAKVFKLVFELLGDNTRDDASDKAAELIAAYTSLVEEDEQ